MALRRVQNSPGDEDLFRRLAHLEEDHQAKKKSEKKECEMPLH